MIYYYNTITEEIFRSTIELSSVSYPIVSKGPIDALDQYPLEVLICDNPPTGDLVLDSAAYATYIANRNATLVLQFKLEKVKQIDSEFERRAGVLTVELQDINVPYPFSEQKTFTTKAQEAQAWLALTGPQKTAEINAYPLATQFPTILGEVLTSQGSLIQAGIDALAGVIVDKAHLYKYKAGEIVGHRRSLLGQIEAVTETDPALYKAALDTIDITTGWAV